MQVLKGLLIGKGDKFWHLLMKTRKDRKLCPHQKLTDIRLGMNLVNRLPSSIILHMVLNSRTAQKQLKFQ